MKIIWISNSKPEQINRLTNHEFNLILICSGFLFCTSGVTDFCFISRQIICIPPGMPFKFRIEQRHPNKMAIVSIDITHWHHPHYRLQGIVFSASVYSKLSVWVLKRTEFIYFSYLLRMLDFKLKTAKSKTDFETGLIDFLLWKEFQSIAESEHNTTAATAQIAIAASFYHSLPSFFKSEHSVKFYADRLCVTPDYLNKSVKEVGGQSVRQMINSMLIQEGKWLLKDNQLNITEVGEKLGFSSLAVFSKFFKKHTGQSPEAYKNNIFKNRGDE